jgi:hypothetical protein
VLFRVGSSATDWRIVNDTNILTFNFSNNDFSGVTANLALATRMAGFGTTSPGYRLGVQAAYGDTPKAIFSVSSSTASDGSTANTYLIVNASGYVGIGTTTVSHPLTVSSNNNDFTPVYINRIGVGSDNGTYWGFGSQNAAANDGLILGQTSTTYTTGGSLSWLGNNETFLYSPGTFKLGIGLTGVLTALSGGNVGIGTSSPYAKFSVHAKATDTNLQLLAVASSTASATSTLFVVTNTGYVGIGTSSPYASLAVSTTDAVTSVFSSSHTGATYLSMINTSAGGHDWWFGSTGSGSSWGAGRFAIYDNTASANRFLIDTAGNTGISSTTPWARLSVDTSSLATGVPSFAVGSSSRTDLIVTQAGSVGIATTTPATGFQLAVHGNTILGSGSASVLTLNVGQVNRIAATTTIPNQPNGYSISTSTATGNGPVISISGNSATSTISFFGATTTALTAGGGVSLNAANRNMLIIGNGKTQANVAVVNGNICIDNDGWCSPATTTGTGATGQIMSRRSLVGGFDLAEMYSSDGTLQAGDIVMSTGFTNVAKATTSVGVIGVVSTDPGSILGSGPDGSISNPVPVALAGRVPVKVSLEGGPIAVGDRIALSSLPGVGKKAGALDTFVGTALQNYDAVSTSTTIEVFMNLDSSNAALAQVLASTTATTSKDALLAGAFANAAQALKTALGSAVDAVTGLAQAGIRELGLAVHASLGVFDNLVSQTITATVLNVDQVNAKTICLDGLCITKDQLQNLLNGQGGGSGGRGGGNNGGGTGGGADTEAPVVTLNGNNPATVSVGDTYTDLGATVTDNVDQNLGFTVSLDGGATTTIDQLVLDTATSTTHTILFSATDNAGNVGTATRTVHVQ